MHLDLGILRANKIFGAWSIQALILNVEIYEPLNRKKTLGSHIDAGLLLCNNGVMHQLLLSALSARLEYVSM